MGLLAHGSPVLRFWKVTETAGEEKDQHLYIIKIDKGPRGQKLREHLQVLNEEDVLEEHAQALLRGDHAPRGRICRAIAELLDKHKPKKGKSNKGTKKEKKEISGDDDDL